MNAKDNRRIPAKDRPGVKKQYIGDGVYAVFDGRGIWLTTEDGIVATDAIYVEPEVLVSLLAFYRGCVGE